MDGDQSKDVDLIVYPNPSASVFYFELESPDKELFSINLYDMNGRLILCKEKLNPDEIIIIDEDLAVGVYSAVVVQGEMRKTVRINKIEK